MIRLARDGHGKDSNSRIVRQPHLTRVWRQINRVRKNVTRDIWFVSIGRVTVSANPGNFIAFDETGTDLIDAADNASGRIVADDQIFLDGLWSPGLSAGHRRHQDFL